MNKVLDVFVYQIPLARSDKFSLKNINNNLPSTNAKNEFSAGLYFCSLILRNDFSILINKYFFNVNGKPMLESGKFGFSISYTDNYVYIAIVRDDVVGIDAEQVNSIDINVSEEFMSKRELIKLKEVQNKYKYFYKIWTLKESYLKLIGKGIDDTITNIELVEDEDGRFSLCIDPARRTYFSNFTLKDCTISVASFNQVNCKVINFENTKEFLEKYEN